MTPLEETLHIVLRKYTEKAIMDTIGSKEKKLSRNKIKDLMEGWIAVEEAIVGGLVYKLVPDVVVSRVPNLPMEWIEADLKTKSQFHKYRFLPKGIEVVENHGLKKIIEMYSKDPFAFRDLLTGPGTAKENSSS
jgi:hypothetical protein